MKIMEYLNSPKPKPARFIERCRMEFKTPQIVGKIIIRGKQQLRIVKDLSLLNYDVFITRR